MRVVLFEPSLVFEEVRAMLEHVLADLPVAEGPRLDDRAAGPVAAWRDGAGATAIELFGDRFLRCCYAAVDTRDAARAAAIESAVAAACPTVTSRVARARLEADLASEPAWLSRFALVAELETERERLVQLAERALGSGDLEARKHAARAVVTLGGPEAKRFVALAITRERDDAWRAHLEQTAARL